MDNTELHYLTYDPEEIWDEMITNYVEAGGDILYPGDEKEMLLRSVQADIVQVLAAVDNALRMQTIRYAEGEYLDLLGEMRGCGRLSATAARATVTIVTNNTGQKETLRAGTTMTADGRAFYALAEDFELVGLEMTRTAEIIAAEAGSAGNGLLKGTAMQLTTANEGVKSITVASDAAGGSETEEDDVYRERIRQYGLASVTTGPEQQYEAAAKAVSGKIADAAAVNEGAGEVGVYLILTDDEGKETLLQDVEDALSAEDTRPLTDHVTVRTAADRPYTLHVQYEADGSSAVATALQQAADEYQAWQDNVIGRAFNPDRLMAALYQAGATRVAWGGESAFDSGAVQYTEIGATERCRGSIDLSPMET